MRSCHAKAFTLGLFLLAITCLSTTPAQAQAQEDLCLLYTSPSPRDQRGSRMPSSA